MVDLSHWDIADEFTAEQVVILMHSQDPDVVTAANRAGGVRIVSQPVFAPTYARMKRSYDKTRTYFQQAMSPPELYDDVTPPDILESINMRREMAEPYPSDGRPCYFDHWLREDSLSGFDTQRFSVDEIARWLTAIGQPSGYPFKGLPKGQSSKVAAVPEIDPSDFPGELDRANQAFRAVQNGYGDSSATFKNRIADYLANTYPELTPEAVQRIAIVANPDKAPGRKKRNP